MLGSFELSEALVFHFGLCAQSTEHLHPLCLLLLFDQFITLIRVTLSDLVLQGLLLSLQLQPLLLHGISSGSQFSFFLLSCFQLVLIDLVLNLLFLFCLQLAQSFLIMGDLGLALPDRFKQLLILLFLFLSFLGLALGDGLPDHFFFAHGLVLH